MIKDHFLNSQIYHVKTKHIEMHEHICEKVVKKSIPFILMQNALMAKSSKSKIVYLCQKWCVL